MKAGRLFGAHGKFSLHLPLAAHSLHHYRGMSAPSSRLPSPKPVLPPSSAEEVVKPATRHSTTPCRSRRASRQSVPLARLLAYQYQASGHARSVTHGRHPASEMPRRRRLQFTF